MTLKPTFEVSKEGLAKLLDRRGKEFIMYELMQNALDENSQAIDIGLHYERGKGRLFCIDDNPEGFSDLSHAYTLFAESNKKSDPTKRGRFNLGEKLVIAVADSLTIRTTKGTVYFTAQGRRHSDVKQASGTTVEAVLSVSQRDVDTMILAARKVIVPEGKSVMVNGVLIRPRTPFVTFTDTLPTEIADADGYLKPTSRKTEIRVYEPLDGETPTLYEMGIPVVETGDAWHVDIQQKVPLNADRDNVRPAYLQRVRALVANATAERMSPEVATQRWVGEALANDAISSEAVNEIITARFGEKRVIADPSDPEGTKRAVAEGYTVIPPRAFSKEQWANIRTAGAALPAGQVTPSPKPYEENGREPNVIERAKWTPAVLNFERLALDVAKVTLSRRIELKVVGETTWPFAATYGPSGELTVNFNRLGREWFNPGNQQAHIELLLHEFSHETVSDHLSSQFADTVARLGARLAIYFAKGNTLDSIIR